MTEISVNISLAKKDLIIFIGLEDYPTISQALADLEAGIERHFQVLDVRSGKPMTLTLKQSDDDDDKFQVKSPELVLALAEDSLQYAQWKLSEFLKCGDFFPAEFREFDGPKAKQTLRTYFMVPQAC